MRDMVPEKVSINLFRAPGIYIAVSERTSLKELLSDFHDAALVHGQQVHGPGIGEQLDYFCSRLDGNRPWSSWAPPEMLAKPSKYFLENMHKCLPVNIYKVGDICCALELFNPGNELGLHENSTSAQHIVAVIAIGPDPDNLLHSRNIIFDSLYTQDEFYTLVDTVLQCVVAVHVFGGGPSHVSNVIRAYFDEPTIPGTARLWDYFFPLIVVDNDKLSGINEQLLKIRFKVVKPLSDGKRTLLQVAPGFDGVIRAEYREAARLFGMTAAQELHPDYPR